MIPRLNIGSRTELTQSLRGSLRWSKRGAGWKETPKAKYWYDKWGIKCMGCQVAFKRKIFPGYTLKDRDNNRHVTDSQFGWRYGLHSQTIKKLVKEGRLKSRVIPNGPMIFLKKENHDLLEITEEALEAKRSKDKSQHYSLRNSIDNP